MRPPDIGRPWVFAGRMYSVQNPAAATRVSPWRPQSFFGPATYSIRIPTAAHLGPAPWWTLCPAEPACLQNLVMAEASSQATKNQPD